MARRRRQESLGRVVGIGGLLGTAYGYVGTSVYFALGAIALYALGVTPFLILAVGLVFIVTAWSYAEGSAALPEASGVTSFARRAFDPMTGFAAAWALLLDSAVMVAIACSAVPHYLGALWPQLQVWPYDLIVGAGVLVLVIVLNVFGLQESVRLSSLMAALGMATLVLLLLVGFFAVVRLGPLWSQIDLGAVPTWVGLISVVPLAAATFLGLDAVSSRAESALRPGRDVPLAINVVLPVIIVISAGLGVVALSALPVAFNTVPVDRTTGLTVPVTVVPGDVQGAYALAGDPAVAIVVPVRKEGDVYVIPAQEPTGPVVTSADGATTKLYGTLLGTTYLRDPVMGLVNSLPADLDWLEPPLRAWVAIVVAIALVLAANAVVGGSGRVLYSLARHHQVPSVLGRVHFSRMTPYVGIILFGVVSAALLLPRDPLVLFGFFGFGAMIAFTLTHLSVIALRYRERSLPRPFVVPLNIRWRGALLPVPAVAGAAATAVIWVIMVATHPGGRILGFAWMAAGLVLYVAYRRRIGRALLRQPQETQLPSAALSDIDYERILVPVTGTRLSDEMMVLACQLATEKGATIDAVYVVEVPMNLPLDASMERERLRGRAVLDAAMVVAGEFGVEAWPHLVAARRAGRAIVETAEEWSCDVVVMGAPRKQRADARIVGGTVDYVMRHAPGEVLLNLVPHDYPMEGSAAESTGDVDETRGSEASAMERK